jgi:replicative DNA helicase
MSKNDIDGVYCENVLDDRFTEINENFERMSVQDILNKFKGKLEVLEKKYVINSLVEESSPAMTIRERVKSWKQQPEIGCMLQGEIFNTITRGGRKGKLYLRSAGSGVGKTRSMVGDACNLAYPIRYDPITRQWVETGNCEKVLYIMTEQDTEEIDTMIMAYLTGYNEDVFTYGTFDENDPRVLAAMDIMEKYSENMNYARIPDPCSSVVKNLIRRRYLQDGIENYFYDYIFSSPAMLNEYRDLGIREDVALRLFTTSLKNVTVELNIFMMTSTQISNDEIQRIFNELGFSIPLYDCFYNAQTNKLEYRVKVTRLDMDDKTKVLEY